MKTIGILNGPNLDRLGKREPEVYGSETLADLENRLKAKADRLGCKITCFQSNHEGQLIDKLAEWVDKGINAVVLNGAGLTHTSVALRDAIAASDLAVVEVHISHIYQREPFRHTSLTAPVCKGVISGLGFHGYEAAMEFLTKE